MTDRDALREQIAALGPTYIGSERDQIAAIIMDAYGTQMDTTGSWTGGAHRAADVLLPLIDAYAERVTATLEAECERLTAQTAMFSQVLREAESVARQEALSETESRVEAARRDAVAPVLALHRPVHSEAVTFAGCPEDGMSWPCPTALAAGVPSPASPDREETP